jgi:beta-lactamase class A
VHPVQLQALDGKKMTRKTAALSSMLAAGRKSVTLLVACSLLACGLFDSENSSFPEETLTLEERIRIQLDRLNAKNSLHAKHLPSGREVAIRADEPMNSVSVIKISIMVLAYRDAEAGQLNLEERYTLRPEDKRRGSGVLQSFGQGLQPTYRDLITQMIITSDNTATDILITRLGLERVNDMLAELDYEETRLQGTLAARYRRRWQVADPALASLTNREVFERGFPSDPGAGARSFALNADPGEWLGRTTARETSRLLEQIHTGDLTSRSYSDEMIEILKNQKSNSRLPQRIRFQGAVVAHKTGDSPPSTANDVGILYYEGGPTVVSVFTNENRGDFVELEATIGNIAENLISEWQ